jgi:hypothetical protein
MSTLLYSLLIACDLSEATKGVSSTVVGGTIEVTKGAMGGV